VEGADTRLTDKFFGDLDYPGRRKPVNREGPAAPSYHRDDTWSEKPLKYRFAGQDREFYTISHLARALGYSVHAIRLWETQGLMPRTPYRSPHRGNDLSPKGKRLWTREQIEGILQIAKEEKVLLNRKPPTKVFALRVLDLFLAIMKRDQQQST
jgi:hypothetical protein